MFEKSIFESLLSKNEKNNNVAWVSQVIERKQEIARPYHRHPALENQDRRLMSLCSFEMVYALRDNRLVSGVVGKEPSLPCVVDNESFFS